MIITYHRQFRKNLKKRILPNPALTDKFKNRVELFAKNPANPLLLDHSLGGDYEGYRSFSITGDIRIIYKRIETEIIFIDIGTHNQLYNQ